jgi:glutamate/aspartate transport system substrate-binding protein
MTPSSSPRATALAAVVVCLAAAVPPAQAASRPRNRAQGAGEAASAPAAAPHPVLDRIKASGRIVLAHRESSVPFSYYDADKKPVGYALDLCKDLVETIRKHLNLPAITIAYVPVNTSTRIDTIVEGKADLECGSTTNNAERRQKVAFTVPHYITGTRYAVRADSPINELEQFENHILVSTPGSTPLKKIEDNNRDRMLRINVQTAPDNAKALEMVANGQADGFAMDDVQLYGLIAASPDPKKFKVIGKFLTIEPLAIMMSKDDPELKQVVDEEMKRLIHSGEATAIYNRWFMKPIPPKNVPMNLPMSYLLRDFWQYPSDIVPN